MCVNCDLDKLHCLCMIKPLLLLIPRVLRKKRLTFWEISIGVNFISLPRNDEKFDF